jgi:hypothetical protein
LTYGSIPPPIKAWHQLGGLDAQGGGNGGDGLQPHGPLAALDEGDMGAMQAGGIRQGLLREAPL